MPNTVASAGDSCNGGEESVGHPDGEDSVLLSDGLPCRNLVARRAAYAASYNELCPAADESDEAYTDKGGYRYVAMRDRACGNGNSHSERYGP